MNKTFFYDSLEKLINTDSPTGYTKKAISFLVDEISMLGYEYDITAKGNLIVKVSDGNDPLGICAHVDTLGLMVRSIKSDGKLALTTLGSPLLNTLNSEYCRIYTRDGNCYTGTILSTSCASHVFPDAQSKELNIDNLEVRLDLEVKNKDDVSKYGIQSGDIVCIDPKFQITEHDFIKSRFLDDKLSAAILLTLLKEIKDKHLILNRKVYFIFTVYEEVGHGNSYIPLDIKELLGVDMGCIGLDLNCSEYDVSICAKDSSGPYDYDMTSKLITLAKEANINHAVDIYPMYGSDVSCALRGGNDIKGALIGPGVYASHGMERSHFKACEATYALLKLYLQLN
ncbi:MAG: M42 family metallopeptidase [Erysipelotrichaceae bacterium]|nr:M42 family metallopeptidase [Erysipelotrichaceae bacterium]MDY5252713.1 M42 family metallopeptidase [Erysipelotrichaceae bacterium]